MEHRGQGIGSAIIIFIENLEVKWDNNTSTPLTPPIIQIMEMI